jgi:putative flippase GtrA
MATFFKAQAASVVATIVDYAMTIFLVEGLHLWPVSGSAVGSFSGGATHFLVSRNWVFDAQDKKWSVQLTRYILVWAGNLVLNISCLFLLTRYTAINYLMAKVFIAILIAFFYNYALQKRYVFK